MAKKDKKSKAEKKVRTAQKQERKATKKDKKQKARGKSEVDSDAEDVDLDAILEEYARKQEQFLKVTEEPSDPPAPRSSSTLLASPANDNEIFLFGGEYFNGSLVTFNNDLFVYHIGRDEWRKVTSPNSPLPRSGHAWCRGGNTGGVYLFGGEFSSPKQGTFYHYNDFWRLEPSSREWARIEGKGKAPSPPSRSGHRMTFFKNYIILFGGFQDTSQQTKYLNDLWMYDCSSYAWHEPKMPTGQAKPDARSSFSLLPHDSGAVLFGGYSRVKTNTAVKLVKGSARAGATRSVMKPIIHQDCWFLRIRPPPSDAPAGALPEVRWERRKRPANAPNPPRAGATMCHHRVRGIMFGGVHDVEESEEGIDSEFFDGLFAFNVDRNRFFPLTLRRPKTSAKKILPDRGRRERGKQAEEDLLRNLRALEMGEAIEADSESKALASTKTDDSEPAKPEKTKIFEMPHPRFNAQLTVQGDSLFIYGGTYERGDREFTLDELWSVDLNKLDGFTEIHRRELADWQEAEDEDSEEDEDDEDQSDESESDEETGVASSIAESVPSTAATPVVVVDEETSIEEASALTDGLPFPRPFESLRDFYERTKVQWQEIVMFDLKASGESTSLAPKEISSKGFGRAESKWWDCREEIRALEDEQTEAGIGEVVSLADKQAGAGAGRRR